MTRASREDEQAIALLRQLAEGGNAKAAEVLRLLDPEPDAPEPVQWNGRTFGQLSADEKHRAAQAAGQQLSAELQASAAAIGEAMDGSYHGLDLERIYEVADIIEQQVLESKPVGTWWTISAIMRKGKLDDRTEVQTTLIWMVEHKFAVDNGRGGAWVNYGRRK